jgi:alkylhydroperoxidase/carboxymuconolactone decarboxylase family protein YurZ
VSLRARVAPEYEASFGFVPAGVEQRLTLWEQLDPDFIEHVEAIRRTGTAPRALDAKTAQLVTFAVLLAQGSAGAKNHALAAQRLGATKEELAETAVLAYVQAGLGALNLGAAIVNELFAAERT